MVASVWLLLAQQRDRTADAFKDERTLWLIGALIGVLLLGALILSWLQRWRNRQLAAENDNPAGQLTNFRAMYEAGELSKEEYDRILARIANRAKAKPNPKPPERPAPPAPTNPILPPPPEHPG